MGFDWEELLGAEGEDLERAWEANIPDDWDDNCYDSWEDYPEYEDDEYEEYEDDEYEDEEIVGEEFGDESEDEVSRVYENQFTIAGYVARDPYIKEYSKDDEKMTVAYYTVAVQYGNDNNKVNFIGVTALAKNGLFAKNNIKKGTFVKVTGFIRNNDYEKDGKKVYSLQLVATNQITV